jgi:hypothetical protein
MNKLLISPETVTMPDLAYNWCHYDNSTRTVSEKWHGLQPRNGTDCKSAPAAWEISVELGEAKSAPAEKVPLGGFRGGYRKGCPMKTPLSLSMCYKAKL